MNTDKKINEIESEIGYHFRNKTLLQNALIHSSYVNEKKTKSFDNERLEFLGDSVLSLAISEHLFVKYPDKMEGQLTKARSKLVCEATLSRCARNIGLGDGLILGKGEESTGGRDRNSILADAFEAVIAAIYIDGGFEPAKAFILRELSKYVEDAVTGKIIQDYKTYLQEVIQVKKENTLEYVLTGTKGPDHNKTFFVDVTLNGKVLAGGVGKSKKDAEQEAARLALVSIGCFDGEVKGHCI